MQTPVLLGFCHIGLMEKNSGGGNTLGRRGDNNLSSAISLPWDEAEGALQGDEKADTKLAELEDDECSPSDCSSMDS
jgi:hypothetical protein